MASTDDLSIRVILEDAASKGINAIGTALNSLDKHVNKASRGVGVFNRNMSKMKSSFTGLGGIIKNAVNAVSGLRGALLAVGAGYAIKKLASEFTEAASAAENYRVRLKVLLGSQKEANKLFDEMSKYASTVSFRYQDIMDSATTLAGVMRGGVAEIQKWMPIIADLAATSGLSITDTTSQIVRMYSVGAQSAEMFKDRGINEMLGFRAGVKYTAEETKKRLIEAFEDPASRFRGAAEGLANTWEGMLSMMSDRWFQFRNAVMEAGVFDYIKSAFSLLLGSIDRLKKEGQLDEWAKRMASTVIRIFGQVAEAVGWIADGFRGVGMVINAVVAGVATLGRGINYLRAGLIAIKGVVADTNAELKQLRENEQILKGVVEKNLKNLETTATEESYLIRAKKLIFQINQAYGERLRKRKEEAALETPFTPQAPGAMRGKAKAPKGQLSEIQRLQGEVTRFNQVMQTELAKLNKTYQDGLITVSQYYDTLKNKAEIAYNFQKDTLQEMGKAAKTQQEQERVSLGLFQLEEQYQRRLLDISIQRGQAVKDMVKQQIEAHDMVSAIQTRARFAGDQTIGGRMAQEVSDLENQQYEEQKRLFDLKEKGFITEQQMLAVHHAHILEKEKLLATQRKQIVEQYTSVTKTTLSNVSSAFLDFYKATGEKQKAFFQIYKTAAIAETIISTYQAAQKIYSSVASIPYVGSVLAPAAAATAIAAGMARVAVIRSQQMAEGGLIGGHSPHKKADNIPIQATAGEYMQPVETVRYYGSAAMDALRQRLVPPEILAPFANPKVRMPRGTHLAQGGMVSSATQGGVNAFSVNVPITTIDTMDGLITRLQEATENAARTVLNEQLA